MNLSALNLEETQTTIYNVYICMHVWAYQVVYEPTGRWEMIFQRSDPLLRVVNVKNQHGHGVCWVRCRGVERKHTQLLVAVSTISETE